MIFNRPLHNFLIWRIKHIDNNHFTLVLSGLIGALAGLAGVVLKETVHFIQHKLHTTTGEFWSNYVIYFFPMIGIVLTVLITRYYWKERLGHGITDILFSISQKSSIIRRSRMYTRMITSSLTVGFGGSVGLEAPIVVTGSAIGSNIGRLMHMDYKVRTILIGCGSAGAIAGIFNSPIAGVIFASEVMLTSIGFSSFIPLLIAAVSGSIVSLTLLGDDILFSFKNTDAFNAADTPLYILLGVVCGFVSVYFTRVTYFVEERIVKIKHYIGRGVTGGLLLAIIILVFPPIYGEGYDIIKDLLNGSGNVVIEHPFLDLNSGNVVLLIVFLMGIILVKPIGTALTIGSGGSGGIFAPSLFLGGITGFLFATSSNTVFGTDTASLANFTLVGMCGVMSGVLHAPLTAIFLIAEITSGYTLFIPLMLVSTISYMTISYFEKYSIYTKDLIERGEYVPNDKDKQVLSLIHLKALIEKDLMVIHPDKKLKDLVELVKVSKRNIFPVVNENRQLMGIITLDDVRDIMFDAEVREEVSVRSLMHAPPSSIKSGDSMKQVMSKFEMTGAWNLPVIDNEKYIGFVSKSRIFNAYRTKLRQDKQDFLH